MSIRRTKASKRIFEMVIFAMLGTIMFLSDIMMEALPNIHLVGTLTVLYTALFRIKALIPIYVYVFLNGLYGGFALWWVPYLYIWLPLWGMALLVPTRAPRWLKGVLYPIMAALHGLAFGALYAPIQAIAFRLGFKGMIAWIIAGIPFDLIHAAGNLTLGLLILPLYEIMRRLLKKTGYYN